MSTLIKKHNFDVVFDSQKVYRQILDAFSNPTRKVSIAESAGKMFGEKAAFLTVAMTLLDNEVTFCTCGDEILSDDIISLTHSKKERIDLSDFIFIGDKNYLAEAAANAKCGTLIDPHKSATLIIYDTDPDESDITFRGPGIDGEAAVRISKLAQEAIELRDEQNYEYPQGIDLIFINGEGELYAIPRLTLMEVK